MKYVSLVFAFLLPSLVLAAPYTLLVPLGPLSGAVTLKDYLQGVFMVTIGVAGILAVVMIVICSIQMMGAPSVSQKSASKECITNAIFGLLIALGSWILLNTINSDLVRSDLTLKDTTTAPVIAPITGADYPMPTEPGWYFRFKDSTGYIQNSPRSGAAAACIAIKDMRKKFGTTIVLTGGVECFEIRAPATAVSATEKVMRNLLCGNNSCVGSTPIGIKQAPCAYSSTNGVTTGCINVAGLPNIAVSAIKALQSGSGLNIVITGGTELGHATHAPNSPIFDLRMSPALNTYIKTNATQSAMSFAGCRYLVSGFWYTNESTHWHVCAVGQPYWFCGMTTKTGTPLPSGKSVLCP